MLCHFLQLLRQLVLANKIEISAAQLYFVNLLHRLVVFCFVCMLNSTLELSYFCWYLCVGVDVFILSTHIAKECNGFVCKTLN